jgi:hypothetical protein
LLYSPSSREVAENSDGYGPDSIRKEEIIGDDTGREKSFRGTDPPVLLPGLKGVHKRSWGDCDSKYGQNVQNEDGTTVSLTDQWDGDQDGDQDGDHREGVTDRSKSEEDVERFEDGEEKGDRPDCHAEDKGGDSNGDTGQSPLGIILPSAIRYTSRTNSEGMFSLSFSLSLSLSLSLISRS